MIKVVYYISKSLGEVILSEATYGIPKYLCENDIFEELFDGSESDFAPDDCPTYDMYDELVKIFHKHGLYPEAESTYSYDKDKFDMKAIIKEAKAIGIKLFTDPKWDAFCKEGEPKTNSRKNSKIDADLEKKLRFYENAARECLYLSKGNIPSGPDMAKLSVKLKNSTSYFLDEKSETYKNAMVIIKNFPWKSHAKLEEIYKSCEIKDFEEYFRDVFGYYFNFGNKHGAVHILYNNNWPKEFKDLGAKMINEFAWAPKQLEIPEYENPEKYEKLMQDLGINF